MGSKTPGSTKTPRLQAFIEAISKAEDAFWDALRAEGFADDKGVSDEVFSQVVGTLEQMVATLRMTCTHPEYQGEKCLRCGSWKSKNRTRIAASQLARSKKETK